ncbi:MAG: DNA-binding response regulator [Spirochaetaceae bacterium]|nr:MAG: DNA-binding response regulator [Spirochaetaceae bacterium]
MSTRVLLVDDQVMFVENLKVVLETYAPELTIVGIANDGQEAIRKARDLSPDIILMDVRMPGLDGVGATERILKEFPRVQIIMLTVFDDDEYVYQALNRGARGYLLKNMRPAALVSSIKAVLDGAVLISPVAAQKLVAGRANTRPSEAKHEAPDWLALLGAREREVLSLLLEEMSNSEIAEKLFISESTVRNYISGIYNKIGVENRFQAIRVSRLYRSFL